MQTYNLDSRTGKEGDVVGDEEFASGGYESDDSAFSTGTETIEGATDVEAGTDAGTAQMVYQSCDFTSMPDEGAPADIVWTDANLGSADSGPFTDHIQVVRESDNAVAVDEDVDMGHCPPQQTVQGTRTVTLAKGCYMIYITVGGVQNYAGRICAGGEFV